ncbi:MAG TPA: VWA domain-containing protein [Thermoanaerobaculia bacterium]|jgi:Ca-activated chloride channel family protein|nr:VWA domain-containing protein [Thermoanaerobaculia bacterium]
MRFGSPHLLWLLLLAPLVAAAAAWLWRRRLDADAAWASRGLWDRLLPAYAPRRLTLSVATLALAVLGASLALARPRWGEGEQKVERKGVDVVFLVDSSLSMGALDVSPSRLFVAKSLVRRMAQAMPGNRVGLVQTEGDGVVLAPLTLDGGVLDLLLDTIDPGSLPTPGTELATGLETALRLFGEGSEKHRVLVMLTDGEDHGGGLDAEIAHLKEDGVAVFVFGVGTPQGAPVPIPGTSGELKRDADGSVVISQLHEDALEKIARSTGGTYLRVTSAAADPAPAVRRIDAMEKRTIESQSVSTLEERFQWPLALAVLALLVHLAVRPFKALASLAPAPLSRPLPRHAALARAHVLPTILLLGLAALPSLPWQPHLPVWAERWLYNPRERTQKALEATAQGRPKQAVGPADTALRLAPNDPLVQYDAGTAHLGAGHAREAVDILEKAAKGAGPELSPTAHYNLGNARLAAGDAAGAVEAYKHVLRAEPGNQNAKYNLEVALREEQKQKMGGQGSPRGSRGNRSNNQDPSNQQGKGKPNENPNQGNDRRQPPSLPSPQQQGQQQRQGQQGDDRDSQGGGDRGQGQDSRLPQFRNQPEMSGREAASVLSAVENLERQQRRDQAARRARQRAAKGKDW